MALRAPPWRRSKRLLGQVATVKPVAGVHARVVLIALLATVGLIGFLGIRPHQPWIIWLTTIVIALSTDGTVRTHQRFQSDNALSALAYVLLPAMAVLGVGYFAHEALDGYVRPVAGALGGVLVGVIVLGEYHTVDYGSRLYGVMRLALAVATYLVAFALFTIIFTRNIDLPVAATLVGLVSLGLSIELLREGRLLGSSTLLVGFAIGVSMAELRLALYFFPLDGLLAGALLIIGFYLATGIVHHLLDHDLEFGTMAEYLLVGAVGTAAVVITRVYV
jgi:hypothetical protein